MSTVRYSSGHRRYVTETRWGRPSLFCLRVEPKLSLLDSQPGESDLDVIARCCGPEDWTLWAPSSYVYQASQLIDARDRRGMTALHAAASQGRKAMAMAFVDRVKNEIHQRRIPSNTGGGQHIMDSSYNPLSINEDYFFPQTADGRGSSVETLPGGSNLGEIDDLKYFNNKMCRGLRVPSSYLPTGPDDSDRPMNDGRVGTALIQEYRFNQYCERLQRLIITKLDDEFKMFMRWRGFNIDSGLFSIAFNPPQNFASYREAELDTTRVTTYTALEQIPYMSKRFLLKRYLGLTEEEIAENEELWAEERDQAEPAGTTGSDLRGVGVNPADFEGDIATGEEMAGLGEPGTAGAPPPAAAGGAPGAQPGAAVAPAAPPPA